jgi:preprotein translocase subunit SecD
LASRIYIVDNGICSVPTDEEPAVRRYLSEPAVQRVIGRDVGFAWGETFTDRQGTTYRHLYLLKSEPKVTGEALSNAQIGVNYDDGSPAVDFMMNRRGSRRFGALTKENVGKLLAIVLDNVVQSAPRINSEIRTRGQITGTFTEDEARDLAVVLRSGALPAPVVVSEERTVGPSLGEDSIRRGLKSTLIGLGFTILFMAVYYQGCGLLADFALLLNFLLLMAGMALLGATLTLPGIAGVLLSLAMAVDANVLVNERIREELRAGKTVAASIAAGYSRAFLTILDSNLTTLLTALILLQFGSGPIKGFAVTLSLGIVISMFTALVVTRVILDMITSRWTLAKLSI